MLPLFEEASLDGGALDAALSEWGGFQIRVTAGADPLARMLSASRAFFALTPERKAALAIERSPHFRGWSEMRNERDWREQLHLGRECAAVAGGETATEEFWRLQGPNLWPDDAGWRAVVSGYVDAAAALGESILRVLAPIIDGGAASAGRACFEGVGRRGYLVAKLIGYHAQPAVDAVRSGVAPHVDFSWVTINLQDSAGLEVRRPDGAWAPVEVTPGVVWVHAGELLDHLSGGRWQATPHRVINRSHHRTRVSVPVFVNPSLDAMVPVWQRTAPARPVSEEHVHRVLDPLRVRTPFHFGAAEWRRKARGVWCHACR